MGREGQHIYKLHNNWSENFKYYQFVWKTGDHEIQSGKHLIGFNFWNNNDAKDTGNAVNA